MKIKFYMKPNGRAPVEDFLLDLPSDERARIYGCLSNIRELGFDTPRALFRQIKGSLWEIKINTKRAGYRIFYVCIKSQTIVLLHAYKKQSQKAPKKEIELSEKRMAEVLNDESAYIDRIH